MKYRKKPVVIEAFQMTRERHLDNSDWPTWLHQAWQKPTTEAGALFCTSDRDVDPLFIQTLEGAQRVSWNDWIIQGVEGELYSRKPDIFEKTYEAVCEPTRRLPFTQFGPGLMW